ncbi:MAG: hypothetical protein IT483_01125 [Gammaproteobacteria bacterium]|nr:hypothetical protein [Gammaproteobacteria bacterium]
MGFQQVLDAIPIGGVFMTFAIVATIIGEGGYRLGRWRQARTPEEKEGPTGMIVGSLLALLGFLLAISMGMASDRFDKRRSLVLAEANSIGTTYLRAGYLPEPASADIRSLLREYVPLRVLPNDTAELRVRIVRSTEIQAKIWAIAEDLARRMPESDVLAIFIESLNETIDLHESRVTAGVYARVPVTILVLLLAGTLLTLGMVGYNAGLSRRRSSVTAAALIIVMGAVITLVIDIDRPRDGFLTVSQQPLIDLQQQIGAAAGP